MKIIVHNSLTLTVTEALQYIQKEKPLGDLCMDVGMDFVVLQPFGEINIFGQYGADTDYYLLVEFPA